MESATEALTVLQRGLKIFKAFEDAEKALIVLQNLEAVQGERQKAADLALSNADAAKAEQATAEAELKAAKGKAKRTLADAETNAAKIVAEAQAAANEATTAAAEQNLKLAMERDQLVAELMESQQSIEALRPQLEEARATIARAEKAKIALMGV